MDGQDVEIQFFLKEDASTLGKKTLEQQHQVGTAYLLKSLTLEKREWRNQQESKCCSWKGIGSRMLRKQQT